MSVRLSRRVVVTAVAVGGVAGGLALGFGPIVRSRVRAEAARRRLEVTVDAVSPDWFGVRLGGVGVRPAGTEGLEAHADEVRVPFGLGMHARAFRLRGVSVLLKGTPSHLRDTWMAWRAGEPPSPPEPKRSVLPVSIDGMSVLWLDGDAPLPRLEVHGAQLVRDVGGLRA